MPCSGGVRRCRFRRCLAPRPRSAREPRTTSTPSAPTPWNPSANWPLGATVLSTHTLAEPERFIDRLPPRYRWRRIVARVPVFLAPRYRQLRLELPSLARSSRTGAHANQEAFRISLRSARPDRSEHWLSALRDAGLLADFRMGRHLDDIYTAVVAPLSNWRPSRELLPIRDLVSMIPFHARGRLSSASSHRPTLVPSWAWSSSSRTFRYHRASLYSHATQPSCPSARLLPRWSRNRGTRRSILLTCPQPRGLLSRDYRGCHHLAARVVLPRVRAGTSIPSHDPRLL